MKYYINGHVLALGTVSHGTLRNEDLLKAFCEEIERYASTGYAIVTESRKWLAGEQPDENESNRDEIGQELVIDLIDQLNAMSPDNVYFGTLDGDASDFGWWVSEDESD